jgi:hypothetical protein
MRRSALGLALALSTTLGGRSAAQPDSAVKRPFSFAVLGHVRGERDHTLNPKLGELLDHVRALRPDFVVLTGDIIWGDLFGGRAGEATAALPDTAVVRREWERLDSALATLHVPVYRVPGNHDISDLGTKQVWWRRYGPLPRAVERYGSRLLLVSSAWIPADNDTVRRIVTRPPALDSAETAWLQAQLGRSQWAHTFVFMHHLIWWDSTASWWKDIHPLLRPAGVRAVFSGDYGPLKFSHLTRDSVLYVQGSMEGIMKLNTLRAIPTSRILSAQFDNFLFVRVNGPAVDVQVKTLGEWSSPQYQPAFFQGTMEPPPPPVTGWQKWTRYLVTPRKLAALGGFALVAFLAGWMVGKRKAR